MNLQPHYLQDVLILLAASVVVVPLFQRLRLGAILGFLFAGVLVGPAVFGWVDDKEGINQLAELGVVFMLFIIGMEVKPRRLWVMRRLVFGLGGLQVLTTGLVLTGIGLWLGQRPGAALIAGFGLALSSTAFVVQWLSERGELNSVHGRATFGVLLLQDIAVVPLLALVPLFADRSTAILDGLGFAALETLAIIAFIVIGGRFLLRPALDHVAGARTPEVFAAAALLVILGSAWLMEHAGLSMAMGAFIAGLLLSESRFRHQLEADVLPFKGLLMGLFFIAIGMRLDLSLLVQDPLTVVGLLLTLLLVKASIMWCLARLSGHGVADSSRMALLLAQSGEFGLVLMVTATDAGIFSAADNRMVVLVVILSMALTPLLGWASCCVRRAQGRRDDVPQQAEVEDKPQVIIGGFGRVGRGVAQMLDTAGVSYAAVENDCVRVDAAKRAGFTVYFGDIGRCDVLRSVGGEQAHALVLAVEHAERALLAVDAIKASFPDLRIYARARDFENSELLRKAGADHVVPEVLESTVELAGATLSALGMNAAAVASLQAEFRRNDYARLDHGRLFDEPADDS